MNSRINEEKIDELLSRSIDTIYPSKEALKKELLSGRRLTVYAGADATGNFLHLGHAINYFILKRFHELGHRIIVLIGDFTAMIGDPTDKSSARVRLTREEVEANLKTFKEQIGKILDFDNSENPIEFRLNSEWLSKLSFEDVVDLASNFTVQNMIERDTFQKRLKEEKPLYVHEFLYPLMQGYDSVAMDVDVEIGGTDQTFNMLAGRTLVKRYLNKEKFVVTHPLLENPETGEVLMSKSQGTGIALNDTPDDMYGKTMALPDAGMALVFEHCTELDKTTLKEINKEIQENPFEAKKRLAREIISFFYGRDVAEQAQDNFLKTFQEGGVPDDIKVATVAKGELLSEVLVREALVASKSEYRRLIEGGAIKIMERDEVVEDIDFTVERTQTYKIGKRRFIKVEVQ